jgi:hypothetical protein
MPPEVEDLFPRAASRSSSNSCLVILKLSTLVGDDADELLADDGRDLGHRAAASSECGSAARHRVPNFIFYLIPNKIFHHAVYAVHLTRYLGSYMDDVGNRRLH